jgi:hypothetical protein
MPASPERPLCHRDGAAGPGAEEHLYQRNDIDQLSALHRHDQRGLWQRRSYVSHHVPLALLRRVAVVMPSQVCKRPTDLTCRDRTSQVSAGDVAGGCQATFRT